MAQLFSYNVLKVRDKGAFTSHLERIHAPAVLFYQTELVYARELKARFPNMIVIVRNWPDSELHKHISPDAWIAQHEAQAAGGLYLYTMNESGLSQAVVDWHLAVMDLAIAKGIHLVLLNPATGTWDIPDFERLKPLLIKASQHRDLFIIGLHSYAGGIITSGIAGGFPPNAGIASDPRDLPGSKGVNLLPRIGWPSAATIAANNWTTFHLGRHKWLIRYCESIGLKGDTLPRLALTETGFDFLSDIGDWLKTFNLPPGYGGVSGWRTLKTQWGAYFPDLGDASQAFVEQFTYAAENLLQGLEFALFFAYGDDGNWTSYNVDLSDIPMLLETYAQKAVEVSPKLIEKPTYATITRYARVNNGGGLNMRYGYGTTFHKLKGDTAPPEISKGDKVVYYLPSIHNIDRDWVYGCILMGENKGLEGWFSLTDLDAAPTKELPTIPPPDVTPPPINPVVVREVRVKIAGVDQARVDAIGQLISTYLEATGAYVRSPELQFEVSKGV